LKSNETDTVHCKWALASVTQYLLESGTQKFAHYVVLSVCHAIADEPRKTYLCHKKGRTGELELVDGFHDHTLELEVFCLLILNDLIFERAYKFDGYQISSKFVEGL